MKQFFKTVAMLSTVALMFSACSDDGVKEDTGDTKPQIEVTLTAPEVTVEGGFQRAIVNITTAADEGATKNVISWGEKKDTIDVSVEEYEITDALDGELSVSVVSANIEDYKVSEAATAKATVYGEIYAETLEVPTFKMDTKVTGVEITWTSVSDDCVGMVIKYGEDKVIEVEADAETTVIDDAIAGEMFTYYSLHQPAGCIDEIATEETEAEFEAVKLSAASNLQGFSGLKRAKLTWSVPAEEGITGTEISWNNGDDTQTVAVSGDAVEGKYEMTFELSDVAEGSYAFELTNVGANGAKSSTLKKTIAVYGDEYVAALVAREYKLVLNAEGQMVFTWGAAPKDFVRATLAYGNTTVNILPDTEETIVEDVEPGAAYTFTAVYAPSNGLDEVTVESAADLTFPAYAIPDATEVSAVPGNGRAIVSYTVPVDENLTKAILSDGTNEYTVELTAEEQGTAKEYEITGLAAGDYVFTVQMADADGTFAPSAKVEATSVSVYDDATYADKFAARQFWGSTYDAETSTATVALLKVDAATGAGNTYITYEGADSTVVSEVITPDALGGTIVAVPGAEIKISTEYTPYVGALDPVNASVVANVPDQMIDKTKVNGWLLPGDAYPLGYKPGAGMDYNTMQYGIMSLFDADNGAVIFHTENDMVGRPTTFDMGQELKITSLKLWPRVFNDGHYYGAHMPKNMIIWAAKELTVEMQTAGTETAPSYEGWTKIGEAESSANYDAASSTYFFCPPVSNTNDQTQIVADDRTYLRTYGHLFNVDTEETYRYLRIQWVANWGATVNIEVGGFDIMGTDFSEGTAPEVLEDPMCTLSTPTEVAAAGGSTRAEITYTLPGSGDGTNDITEIVVSHMGTEIASFPVTTDQYGTTVVSEIKDLAAGDYALSIKATNKEAGVYSEETFASVTVYDETSLATPKVTVMYKGGSDFEATFDVATLGENEIKLTFTDGDGAQQTVATTDGVAAIANGQPNSDFSFEITAYPFPGALDQIKATGTGSLPETVFEVPSTNFAVVTLPGDAVGQGSGYSTQALWNGIWNEYAPSNHFHSKINSYNRAITIDLGAVYDLSGLRIYQRWDRPWTNNNLRSFKFYTSIEDPTANADLQKTTTETRDYYDAGVVKTADVEHEIPDFSSWTAPMMAADEAVDAGYVSGAEMIIENSMYGEWNPKTTSTVDMQTESLTGHDFVFEAGTKARYIRIQLISTWSGSDIPGVGYEGAATFDGWFQFSELKLFGTEVVE